MTVDHKGIAGDLFKERSRHSLAFPKQSDVEQFAVEALEVLFPHFAPNSYPDESDLEKGLVSLESSLRSVLCPLEKEIEGGVDTVVSQFFGSLEPIQEKLSLDVKAHFDMDPACVSEDEVILAYPGFFAVAIHRIAHCFLRLSVPLLPRMLSEYAHLKTGIDIHPGATIGDSFAIDHGTGIVIGETSVIGKGVKMYQGSTLGGVCIKKELADHKRHPTIEDNVVIYANATILGGDTVIGHDSIVGASVWLTESVPPNSVVYHKPEIKMREK